MKNKSIAFSQSRPLRRHNLLNLYPFFIISAALELSQDGQISFLIESSELSFLTMKTSFRRARGSAGEREQTHIFLCIKKFSPQPPVGCAVEAGWCPQICRPNCAQVTIINFFQQNFAAARANFRALNEILKSNLATWAKFLDALGIWLKCKFAFANAASGGVGACTTAALGVRRKDDKCYEEIWEAFA